MTSEDCETTDSDIWGAEEADGVGATGGVLLGDSSLTASLDALEGGTGCDPRKSREG